MSFWKNKRVLVTGGAGFIGSHVVELLVEKDAKVRVADNLENGNLENLEKVKNKIEFTKSNLHDISDCLGVCKDIDIVLNLAAKVGGIEFNKNHPGTMFRDNILIGANMLEAAKQNNVERFLAVSSACVYPRFCKVPTPESEGFRDAPESTNDGYGWAKRMAEFQATAYNREFGMKIAIARPYNTYGPRDHFDLEKSHVIPALIKRIFDGENPLVVWGDGQQTRAFIYVTDTARGLISVIEKYPDADPVNIGTDQEIEIKDLVKMILEMSGAKTEVIFDASRPSGQPRRNSDNSKAMRTMGFRAEIDLRKGLKMTIDWYKELFQKKR